MSARLTETDLVAIAELARIELRPHELAPLVEELGAVLEHMAALATVDTAGVPPMTHAVPMTLALRDDVVEPALAVELALASAPARDGDGFRVPAAIQREDAP